MLLSPAECDKRPGSRSCSLFYIAGRLGHRERSLRWLASYVETLIAAEHFPPPIILIAKGQRVAGVTARHRWNLDAVDAWFDGLLPPAAAAFLTDALATRFAGLLDQRAAEMAA